MSVFAAHLADELRVVRGLLDSSALLEAYTIGHPGTLLVLDGDADRARATPPAPPLVGSDLVDIELFELTAMTA